MLWATVYKEAQSENCHFLGLALNFVPPVMRFYVT